MFKWVSRLFNRRVNLPAPSKPATAKPIFVDGALVDIEIHDLEGFDDDQRKFFVEAAKLQLEVLSSQEFKDQFLGMKATELNGKMMEEIYNLILSGKDKYNEIVDNDIDIMWGLFGNERFASRTIGYTYPNILKVFTNRYYFRQWMKSKNGKADLAGHIMHESMHNYGFDHNRIKSTSLVYKTGDLISALGKKAINGQKLTPILK